MAYRSQHYDPSLEGPIDTCGAGIKPGDIVFFVRLPEKFTAHWETGAFWTCGYRRAANDYLLCEKCVREQGFLW